LLRSPPHVDSKPPTSVRRSPLRFEAPPLASEPLLRFDGHSLASAPLASIRSPPPQFEAHNLVSKPLASISSARLRFEAPHFAPMPFALFRSPCLGLQPLASTPSCWPRFDAPHLVSEPLPSSRSPSLRFRAPSLCLGTPGLVSKPLASDRRPLLRNETPGPVAKPLASSRRPLPRLEGLSLVRSPLRHIASPSFFLHLSPLFPRVPNHLSCIPLSPSSSKRPPELNQAPASQTSILHPRRILDTTPFAIRVAVPPLSCFCHIMVPSPLPCLWLFGFRRAYGTHVLSKFVAPSFLLSLWPLYLCYIFDPFALDGLLTQIGPRRPRFDQTGCQLLSPIVPLPPDSPSTPVPPFDTQEVTFPGLEGCQQEPGAISTPRQDRPSCLSLSHGPPLYIHTPCQLAVGKIPCL